MFSTALPPRSTVAKCDDGRPLLLWPDVVIPIAASAAALQSSGGTATDMPDECVAVVTVGINSGVLIGLKGGENDQWLPVFNGMLYPLFDKRFYLARSSAAADGTVYVCGFKRTDDAFAWKQFLSGASSQEGNAAGSALLPNISVAADEAVPGGGSKTHGFTVANFQYCTILADPANAATILIGPSIANALFPLRPGDSVSGFVGNPAVPEFGFSGTSGDDLHIIEYGRS